MGCAAQVDPLQPPKFKHKRVPRGPGTPPPPVHHSPPRKLTQKDQKDWKIPPCVSNWKNAKGYTIPLEKRLQADGRGPGRRGFRGGDSDKSPTHRSRRAQAVSSWIALLRSVGISPRNGERGGAKGHAPSVCTVWLKGQTHFRLGAPAQRCSAGVPTGAGLQDSTINDKFAALSEDLYLSERKAREEIKIRAALSPNRGPGGAIADHRWAFDVSIIIDY